MTEYFSSVIQAICLFLWCIQGNFRKVKYVGEEVAHKSISPAVNYAAHPQFLTPLAVFSINPVS
jgi:hypothetical protein